MVCASTVGVLVDGVCMDMGEIVGVDVGYVIVCRCGCKYGEREREGEKIN